MAAFEISSRATLGGGAATKAAKISWLYVTAEAVIHKEFRRAWLGVAFVLIGAGFGG
jgi:hypothetical protein